jgi:septal ring factor EnvC (AmiA/AmiB activator)
MDERTKSILVIEQKIAGEMARIDGLSRGLGQLLLERSSDGRLAADRAGYDKIGEETARLDEALLQVEKDSERVSEIDRSIADEERLAAETKERLAVIYPDLGKLVTQDEAFLAFSSPYRARIAAAQQKIDSLNGRLNEIEEKGNANVFVWLGKGAQNLVIKSFLAKTQSSRERVYAEAGAEFVRNRPVAGQSAAGEIEAVSTAAELLRNENNERDLRIIALKEEKRTILSSFGREGSANRKKAEIARQKERLIRERGEIYLRLGRKAEDPSTRFALADLFDDEMTKILENIACHRELAKDYEDQIDYLKTSLEIDKERAEIEGFQRAIAEQRKRIAAAEEAITRHEKSVAAAHKRIEQLTQSTQSTQLTSGLRKR